jgi:Domain of unknown function (DUF4440)
MRLGRALGAVALLYWAASGPALAGKPATAPTARELERATQALVDAIAPGERAVWEHYTDPRFVYVTEDNEVQSRAQMLDGLKPLPPGYSGWIVVQEFQCTDFGAFATTTYIMDEHEAVEGHQLHARYRESDTWRTTSEGWRLVAGQIWAIPQDPPRTAATAQHLEEYAGSYTLSPTTRQVIRRVDDHLVAERAGRAPQLLLPESGDVFFTPGHPRTRRVFTRATDGSVDGFADRREGIDLLWTRLPPGAAPP